MLFKQFQLNLDINQNLSETGFCKPEQLTELKTTSKLNMATQLQKSLFFLKKSVKCVLSFFLLIKG